MANETVSVGLRPMDSKKAEPAVPVVTENAGTRKEVRCAVRFPISLAVVLTVGDQEIAAQTRNISASGVLFELGVPLEVGAPIEFSMRMPREVLGAGQDVLVYCTGRVVRCTICQNQYLAAATIDEYRFAGQEGAGFGGS